MHYTCIACKSNPQVYLEKCKYRTEKVQMSRFINTELKSDSDSKSSDSDSKSSDSYSKSSDSDSESSDSDSKSSDSDSESSDSDPDSELEK